MEQLYELQEVDTHLDALARRRRNAQEHELLRAANDAVAQASARRSAGLARLAELDRRIAENEEKSRQLSTIRARLQAQLRSVVAPREAEALMHEIEIINARRSELDDAELGHLEAQEQLSAELDADDAEDATRRQKAADAQRALDTVLGDLDSETESARRQRDERSRRITPALLTRYERLRANLDGVGVARLEGRQCSGCHLLLSPAELDGVKSIDPDAVVECPQCSRLLVR